MPGQGLGLFEGKHRRLEGSQLEPVAYNGVMEFPRVYY